MTTRVTLWAATACVVTWLAGSGCSPWLDPNPTTRIERVSVGRAVRARLVARHVDPAPHRRAGPSRRASPLAAPRCAGLRLAAVSEVPEQRDSFATFELANGTQLTRRFGGHVEQSQVVYVGDHPGRGPSAWLLQQRELCQLTLSADRPTPEAAAPTAAPISAVTVEDLGAGRYRVDRGKLLDLLDTPEMLAQGLNGRVQGDAFVIRGLSPSAPLARAGLRRGDRILRVGGVGVRDARGLLRLLADATRRDALELRILRDGQEIALDYQLQ